MTGTPVCRGKYQGTARIVTKLSDAKLIQQGDVLITISTDIGWSPYFPLLGGVVTELGNPMSEGDMSLDSRSADKVPKNQDWIF